MNLVTKFDEEEKKLAAREKFCFGADFAGVTRSALGLLS